MLGIISGTFLTQSMAHSVRCTQEVGVDHPAAYFLMQLIALVPSGMGFRKVWINPGEPRIVCLLYSKPNRNNFHRMK